MHHYPWLIVNMLLHGAAVLLLPLVAALLWRDHGRRVDARLGAALAVGSALFAFITTPGVMPTPTLWHAPFLAVVAGKPVVIWLLSRALLDDEFRLRPWHAIGWAAMAAWGTALAFMPHDPRLERVWVVAGPTLALMLLTALQAFAHWREDLVEERRHLRLAIVVSVALYMFGSHLLLIAVFGNERLGAWRNTLTTAALLALSLFIAWRIVRVPRNLFDEASPALRPVLPAGATVPQVDQPDPRLIDALNELMQVEQVYREDNLTIAALAKRMKLPEPRLRQLINKELGHRNFNAFLNAYRIDDAKRALADPRYAEVPILTISAEAGFQSLGPFNRAFKAATGMTPTDFRRGTATVVPARSPMG